jgi:hypothetical protein
VSEPAFLTDLERRAEAVLEGARRRPVVRLVREDVVGRAGTIGTAVFAWIALALLDVRFVLVAAACASVAWVRLKRLPPAREPDPDDWL